MDEQRYRQAEQRLWEGEGVTPVERFVRLPRHGVDVRIQELGEGPPVLFVHGGPAAGSTFAPLAARLSGFRTLILDRPGTGLSGPYVYHRQSLREHYETLVADVLDALEVEQAHLVGSSSGSDYILLASARYPDRVLRTVHLGCPGFAPGIRIPFNQRLIALPGMWRLAVKAFPTSVRGMRSTMKMMGHGASVEADRIPQAWLEWSGALFRHTATLHHEVQCASLMLTLRGYQPWLVPTKEEFAAVKSPTFIIWGADDAFGDESVGRHLAGLIPNANLESFPGAGHLPWLDDPDRAAAATQRHLSAGVPSSGLSAPGAELLGSSH